MLTPTIKPILKYPGAKWNCANWIIGHFPAHMHYVEPFFGSGAVFFNKAPARHEVINDLSGDVVNLFRVIRDDGERLAALIEMTPWAREEYELSYQPSDDPMERARRFLIRTWQGHGGRSTTSETPQGWRHNSMGGMLNDSFHPDRWQAVGRDVLAVARRLTMAEIERRPAARVIAEYNDAGVLVYADPPYPLSTRNGKMYQYEMTDADHLTLLDALDAHPGPVVLSGYHCALYDDRLAHWSTRERRVQAEKGNTRTEVLWLNPVCVERLGYGPLWGDV